MEYGDPNDLDRRVEALKLIIVGWWICAVVLCVGDYLTWAM